MTFEEFDRMVDQRLAQHSSPVIEFNRLPIIAGIPPGSWFAHTRFLTPEELPKMFRAGGSQCMFVDDGRKWLKAWARHNPKRCGITEVGK